MVLLNLSLSLATAATTMPSPYAWIRTNVHFLLLVAISYELERRDLQVRHSTAQSDRQCAMPALMTDRSTVSPCLYVSP